MPAKTSQLYIGDGEYVEKTSREITLTSEVKAKIDNIPAVVNSFDSASTTDALSAAAGKQLKDLVDSVWTIWKYLSAWDCATWLPVTDPIDNPHLYKVWDYYVISNVAASSWTNYRPDSVKYEHWVASTAVETWTPALNDSYYYDWVQRVLQPSGWRTIVIDSSLSSTSTNPVENRIINSALNWKQATISDLATIRSWAALGATAIQPGANISTLTNNSWFVTSGTVDSKIATATSDFVTSSTVDSKIAAATTDFVTSDEVDTQIGTALTTWNYTTATDVSSAISTATQWMVTETSLATKGYQTQWEVNAAISNATLHMAETWDNITEFVNNAWYQTASQVSNTVNTAVAGKQDTLVSWTNIKTVNWTSILGAWDITIQGWWISVYDAVVASDWTWDYTTLWWAISANKKNIFIKNWNYNESAVTTTNNALHITWESIEWVKLTYSTFDCITINSSSLSNITVTLDVKNITISATWNSWWGGSIAQEIWCVFRMTNNSTNTNKSNFNINNCNFNLTDNWDYYCSITSWHWQNTDSKVLISNCNIYVDWENWCYRTYQWRIWQYLIDNSHIYCKWTVHTKLNITYWVIQNSYLELDNTLNTTTKWAFSVSNADNCSFHIVWWNSTSTRTNYTLSNCTNCSASCSRVENERYSISRTTQIKSWTENTSYSVWDMVIERNTAYIRRCNTAHTSSDDIYDDDAKWDYLSMNTIIDCNLLTVASWWCIYLDWKISASKIEWEVMIMCWESVITWCHIWNWQQPFKVCGKRNNLSSNLFVSNTWVSVQDEYWNVVLWNMMRSYTWWWYWQFTKLWTWWKAIMEHNMSVSLDE